MITHRVGKLPNWGGGGGGGGAEDPDKKVKNF